MSDLWGLTTKMLVYLIDTTIPVEWTDTKKELKQIKKEIFENEREKTRAT